MTKLSSTQSCKPIFQYIDQYFSDFQETLVQICEVPAPSFQEQHRAKYLASLFKKFGFDPSIDEVGNLRIPVSKNGSPHLVVSAHLDTVFSFNSIRVAKNPPLFHAPGISDDSAGLAALLILGRAFHQSTFPGSLTMVATVGEEGLGNLRGTRHLFSSNGNKIDFFLSLDGSDPERLITAGLASKRVRITFLGPGGHSWGDAGTPNPIHVAGELLFRINRFSLPEKPKTTINTGIIAGGTSINAIPAEVFLDVDLRSESASALQNLDDSLSVACTETAKKYARISFQIVVLGERPAGGIAEDHPLVKLAIAANQSFGFSSKLESGSTDSNIPFASGIPALTIGVGGRSGKIHTPEEWYDVTGAEKGLKRTALLIAGLLQGI